MKPAASNAVLVGVVVRNTIATLRWIISGLVLLFAAACFRPIMIPEDPVGYPDESPVQKSVLLEIPEELGTAKWAREFGGSRDEVVIGPNLAMNCEALARAKFSSVSVRRDDDQKPGSDMEQDVDAVLTPRLVTASRNLPPTSGEEQETVLILEWRVTDRRSGNLLWQETVIGRGTGPGTTEGGDEQFREAIEELFLKSYQGLEEIRW